MSKHPKQDFDPRFNPAFQRGFAGNPETDAALEPDAHGNGAQGDDATLVHPFSPPPADSPAPPPAPATPVARAEEPAAVPAPAPEPSAAIVSLHEQELHTISEQEGERGLRGRNPFLLVLAAVAVLLVGIGGWVYTQARAGFDDTASIQSQGDFLGLQTMIAAAPSIILLGVATGIGVLFVFAARWRGKP